VLYDVILPGRTLTVGFSPPVKKAITSIGCLLPCRLQSHRLKEQASQCYKMTTAELRERPVIRLLIAREHPKPHVLMQGSLQSSR